MGGRADAPGGTAMGGRADAAVETAGRDGWEGSARVPIVAVAPGFRAPLFVSRGCFAKHVLNRGACPAGCPRRFRVQLRQGGRRFEAVVQDCVTYLFA